MRIVIVVSALSVVCACRGSPANESPARLVLGQSDTVVVNSRRPVRIPVRALDADGKELPGIDARFDGATVAAIPLSTQGEVTCTQRGDVRVRVSLGAVATQVLVRCRPVETVRLVTPIQLVMGDTARLVPLTAYAPDNRPVELLAARVWVSDSSVVALDGLSIRPRAWGTSSLAVEVGDRQGWASVHVYDRASTLEEMRRERRLLAVPVQLAAGEMRRWSLAAGDWMLTMWPEEDEEHGPQLRIERASCEPLQQISKRRYHCWVNDEATVIVQAPRRAGSSAVVSGTLAVRPLDLPRRASLRANTRR
jgi:hypothetical protein